MINGKKVLAFIPARGGSKGIKDKNIIDIVGKPLIAYTIEAAKNSEYIDEIIVSTDSERIAEVATEYGASVPFLRPLELASDISKTIDAVVYTLSALNEKDNIYDILVLLQPTGPLRTSEHIDEAIKVFFDNDCLGLTSISEVKDNPILMRRVNEDGNMSKFLDLSSTVRRQDMEKVYRVNGSIYINSIKDIDEKTSFNDNPIPYIMAVEDSIDIDDYSDLEIAKYYLKKRMGECD